MPQTGEYLAISENFRLELIVFCRQGSYLVHFGEDLELTVKFAEGFGTEN